MEKLRYRFYIVEQSIACTLRPATRFADVCLYVLITESLCRRPWLETAEQAILGGADCLQLREKQLDAAEFLRRARLLTDLCHRHNVLCIINDRPDIAVLAGADGVHVGQEDLPAIEARKIVGHGQLVGVSTHRIGQARQAVLDGADYIGIGPVFPSSTKPRDILPGLDYARQVADAIRIPAVAIAGITHENVAQVMAAGIRAVAVTAAVVARDDVQSAARELKHRLAGQTFLSVAPEPPPAPVGQTFLSVPSAPILTHTSAAPSSDELRKRRRHLPHWTLAGSTYFITLRLRATEFTPSERTLVLDHIRSGDANYYQLLACVIMPDHVHLLIRPEDGMGLSRITKGIKGVTARLINEHRKTAGRIWQDGSFDRIVRDAAEFEEKLVYMYNNPVQRELVANPDDYQWWFVNLDPQD
jgi:thiamine-phosphate diphosphorylase